jgi:hypothetical protein
MPVEFRAVSFDDKPETTGCIALQKLENVAVGSGDLQVVPVFKLDENHPQRFKDILYL